jgi:hypothetical protein
MSPCRELPIFKATNKLSTGKLSKDQKELLSSYSSVACLLDSYQEIFLIENEELEQAEATLRKT